jgi:hypothetical protein
MKLRGIYLIQEWVEHMKFHYVKLKRNPYVLRMSAVLINSFHFGYFILNILGRKKKFMQHFVEKSHVKLT